MQDFQAYLDAILVDVDIKGFKYDPQHFAGLHASDLGKAVTAFMTHPAVLVRMKTAADLDRVAVEPLGAYLVKAFGEEAVDERLKQYVGHMARQIMEYIGYHHDRKNLQITRPNLFSSGSGYRLEPKAEAPMRITREQRENWLRNTANDPFNVWLNAQVKPDGVLDLDKLYAVAEKYGVTKRYDHLNPGQQRMNIGVALRRVVDKSEYAPA